MYLPYGQCIAKYLEVIRKPCKLSPLDIEVSDHWYFRVVINYSHPKISSLFEDQRLKCVCVSITSTCRL